MTPRSQLESEINCRFPTNTSDGIRQGYPVSPILFYFFINDYYAEDAVVLKNSAENLIGCHHCVFEHLVNDFECLLTCDHYCQLRQFDRTDAKLAENQHHEPVQILGIHNEFQMKCDWYN
ncbi:hypothetical protein AYI70_g3258 [Smittium culicis]|uniref:Reverse transcriptase domain-containing protein n=1 Tax=Smittium culicis TaxID=133412 RepID=A0A1R1Y4A5_9FUNG|nr:hypothetical protein AYI70_g3258 [Smittium culicis]